ncbi:sugar kinase [Stieleria varia]|uniref:2-dehydro-3-deoxygluconokinase n=1 Tax=Stieleria varia TaxID=2528005 RepID=A0A5C6B7U8_9BACT|nr:sugar kinase [Stieleria varia]TWU08030.1 2-dehydro-3-deoxygluconokinase [Stieleria varia]
MKRIVTFGEIMGRLTPPGFLRLTQAMPGTLNVTFAGAEANVAASLARFGGDAVFVTALPDNDLTDACIASLQSLGIASHVIRTDYGRLGLYFLETGANQRPSRVLYDRDQSAISLTEPSVYDWPAIFDGADWFHVTGITPALSQVAADATLDAVRTAKKLGLTVSCDLNFRGKLWQWGSDATPRELAGEVMRQILPHVDVLIANEEDCGDVLDIRAESTDVHSGQLNEQRYPDVARRVVDEFPQLRLVATTLRNSVSASHNDWGAMLYDVNDDTVCFAPTVDGQYQPYEIRNIVDRVGGGDAFAAALIFALTSIDGATHRDALDFAVAASCLAHSIVGDTNFVSRSEVEALVAGRGSGRVVR